MGSSFTYWIITSLIFALPAKDKVALALLALRLVASNSDRIVECDVVCQSKASIILVNSKTFSGVLMIITSIFILKANGLKPPV